jgi:outer membrane protein assembly factor BamE
VQQGNIVDPDRLARLELGMSKNDVQALLGTSLLQDSFHPDRWDYFYSLRKARKKDTEKKILTLYFKDGKLNQIVGTVTSTEETGTDSQTKTVIIDERPATGGVIQRGWDKVWK